MWNLFRPPFSRVRDEGSEILQRAVEVHKMQSQNILEKIEEGKNVTKYQLDLATEALAIADRTSRGIKR